MANQRPLILSTDGLTKELPTTDGLSAELVTDLQALELAQAKAIIGTQTEIVENHAFASEDAANVYDNGVSVATRLRALQSELQTLEQQKSAPKRNSLLTGTTRIGGSADYTEIAEDGTVTLAGAATAWDDILVEMKESLKGSATKPDWDATNYGLLFPINDQAEYVVFNVQMPHRWKQGSTVYPHVHFYQNQAQIPTFEIEYRWTNIGDAVSGSWDTYPMGGIVGSQTWTTGLLHRIVHGTNNVGISGSGKTFSSMLQIKLYRKNVVADPYTGDCLVVSFDLHIEIDSFGTSSEYAK